MSRAILGLFLCQWMMAQSQQAPDPSTLARVEGRVVNSVTGEPLRKTQLILHGSTGGEYSGSTDTAGHFVIERIVPGTYNLTSQHQNFAVLEYGSQHAGSPGTRFPLTAGQNMTGIEIKMVPFGVISGKVVDPDGDPVTGVPITVMRWGFMRGGRQLMPAGGGGSTNDRGEYRIYNLPSGRYFLTARPVRSDLYQSLGETARGARAVARPEPVKESFAATFYPSAADATTAAPVLLTAGQEVTGMDIQLRKTRTYTVRGKIAGFQQGRRYSLAMQPQESGSGAGGGSGNLGTGRAAAVRPEDGTFTISGVAPGRYSLVAVADNRVGARQEVMIGDGDLEGLVIAILEPGAIKGKVQIDAGATKPPSLKGIRISLSPVDGIPMNLPNAITGEDGSFSMEEVSADRYKVNCSPVVGAYLRSIRWGGQISNDGTVEMPAGGSAVLELGFAATSAVIEGDVKTSDDQPAAGIPVLLVPASGRESDFRVMMADQKGHFSSKGMAPGNYTALSTDASIFSMPDAEFLKGIAKLTTPVNVEENGRATVTLKMVPEAVIEATQ